MKAVGFTQAGPITRPDALIDFETETPTATGRDLLVRVDAVSVNPVDFKIRKTRPPEGDSPAILGWDAVGEVIETGDQTSLYKAGDRVWYAGAIDRPGTNAEFHLVDERIAGHAPQSIPAASAAALPLTTLTAYEMLFDRLRVNDPVPGAATAVVIIGGAGGVGSIAVQLLRALTDLTVIATASRPETCDWVKALGAHHVIDHSQDLPGQIAALGIGQPGHVFCTTHSQDYVVPSSELLAPQGRFGLIEAPDELNIMPLMTKSISVHWELMFTRPLFQTADMSRQKEILDTVSRLIDAGTIRSTATETVGRINAENLIRAHTVLESGKAKGKLVLEGF